MSNKRSRFIGELATDAKQRGLKFKTSRRRGKGSHMMVWVTEFRRCRRGRSIRRRRARSKNSLALPESFVWRALVLRHRKQSGSHDDLCLQSAF